MEISVAELSVSNRANVFKLCVHLQVGLVYFVNENKDTQAHFSFYFNFFFVYSYITDIDVFLLEFSQQLLNLGL